MRPKASPARFQRLQDQPNRRVTGAAPRCGGAGAGTVAGAPCPRSRVSLPICDRSFSPVLPRSRLAGPRPKPACSQRAPVPLSRNRVTAQRTNPSRTRGRTHRYAHHQATSRQAGSSPRDRARRYYADDDGDVARRHWTTADPNKRRVTSSMSRMILHPFPAFFRFLLPPIVRRFSLDNPLR